LTIRVLLADDQTLLRGTFQLLIDSCDDMEVVGEAADGRQAVELARDRRPDVVLMDIRMPGTDGLAATAAKEFLQVRALRHECELPQWPVHQLRPVRAVVEHPGLLPLLALRHDRERRKRLVARTEGRHAAAGVGALDLPRHLE
jgi:hypothetical protein